MASSLNSTEKVLMILQAFLPDNPPRGTLELCDLLGMKAATVSRILSILKKHRFVQQNMDRKYQLGEVTAELGQAISESKTVRQLAIAKPHLMQLKNILNENIHLEILYEDDVKIAVVIQGSKAVRVHLTAKPGKLVSVNATAGSKTILAFLAPEHLNNIMKAHPKLQKFQENSIGDWDALNRQLEKIRKIGLAYDINEYLEDICAVGTPVFDYSGAVIGAVVVSVPSSRTEIIFEQTTLDILKETAEKITANLRDLLPE